MWGLKSLVVPVWVKPVAVLAVCVSLLCSGWYMGHRQTEKKWANAVMAANLNAARAQIEAQAANDRATEAARVSADQRENDYRTRQERVEGYAHEAKPVPANCPGPDARITAELSDRASAIRAAEDRLRGLRRAASQDAR